MRLRDRRVLVVGASAGIGRASALAAASEGARVAFAGRRRDRLDDGVAQAGPGAVGLVCDVCDEASCIDVVARAADALGGLDALVYAPGMGIFKPLADTTAEDWRRALDTNLVGAAVVARAAMPHLERARGRAVFLSSISIDDAPPRPHYTPYIVAKLGLEGLVRGLQGEHRDVAFTSIAIGDTLSEFGRGLDPATIGPLVQRWVAEGYMYGRVMEPEAVAEQVVNVLASRETVRRLAITPTYPPPG
ncbi:MAG: SDR family oxidoreductase [Myxococcota bacterium]|nr:SDR family oxidoreductase [Myxococcales bacterium]